MTTDELSPEKKAAIDAYEIQRQAKLREEYEAEATKLVGQPEALWLLKQKYKGKGYDRNADTGTAGAQAEAERQEELSQKRKRFQAWQAEQQAAKGAPVSDEQAELLAAYEKLKATTLRNLHGQAYIEEKQKLRMKFYGLGFEGDLD